MAAVLITQPDRTFIATSGCFNRFSQLSESDQQFTNQELTSGPNATLRSVSFRSRGTVVQFQFWDHGYPPPKWFTPVLQGFANLVTLPANWDGEGARRIDEATINRALAGVESILAPHNPPPSVVPVPNGGLQIEWHRRRRDLEIEFAPSGRTEFYFFDEETGEEREGPVDTNFTKVRPYLERTL